MDYENLTLADLEELLGRKPDAVEIRSKWVICTYGGQPGYADVRFHFRKW